MSNHDIPCRYCGEDMRLMATCDHEAQCSSRPAFFVCHVSGCGAREPADLQLFVDGEWRQCCALHLKSIGKAQLAAAPPDFDGETYDAPRDKERLTSQLARVLAAMQDGGWYTLGELAINANAPQQSVSARLRDLRKDKFGKHCVERRHRAAGLWEYRLKP